MTTEAEMKRYREQAEAAVVAREKSETDRIRMDALENATRLEQRNAEHTAKMKRQASQAFAHQGGTDAQFQKLWPTIYEKLMIEATVESMGSGKKSMQNSFPKL